jgi:hypothetical protein
MARSKHLSKLMQLWIDPAVYDAIYVHCMETSLKTRTKLTVAEYIRNLIKEKGMPCKRNKS